MKDFILLHHLGMGDHIILNGLVRHIYEREQENCENFWLICYPYYEDNLKVMYSDLPKMKFLIVKRDEEILYALDSKKGAKIENLSLDKKGFNLYNKIGDDAFFEIFGYDKKLIQKFKIKRNKEIEENLLIKLVGAGDTDYIFVHDDFSRGYPIDITKINNKESLPIIRAEKDVPIFDLLGVMEYAKTIHVISSAFLCICIANPKLAKKTTAHLTVRNMYLKSYVESKGIKVI